MTEFEKFTALLELLQKKGGIKDTAELARFLAVAYGRVAERTSDTKYAEKLQSIQTALFDLAAK